MFSRSPHASRTMCQASSKPVSLSPISLHAALASLIVDLDEDLASWGGAADAVSSWSEGMKSMLILLLESSTSMRTNGPGRMGC